MLSRPEFEDTTPTTTDLLALWIQDLQNDTSNIQIVNNTDIDEFTKIVNMTSQYFNVDIKSRIMFVLSQDRNTGYTILNNLPHSILLVDENRTPLQQQHSPALQEVFDSFEVTE